MLYNYECKEHGPFEAYSKMADRHQSKICPICDKDAMYIVSAPMVKLPGWDTSWPSAASKWERFHEREGRKPPPE